MQKRLRSLDLHLFAFLQWFERLTLISAIKTLLAATASLLFVLPFVSAGAEPIKLKSYPIEYFNIGSSDQSAGKLTFLSGLEIESDNENFGGLSGLRITDGGTRFYSVSDQGHWVTGEILRDEKNNITKLTRGDLSCLCRANGQPYGGKHWGDAEGVEVKGDKAFVVFERLNRINHYDLKSDHLLGPPAQATTSFKPFNIHYSKGLEAMAQAPSSSPLAGKFIAIAEESLDAKSNNRGFIADEKTIEEFSVKRTDDYSITDATFLSNGDLLILERRFGLSIGIGTRIRLIDRNDIKPGALIKGKTIMEAGLTSRIDNMEGITTWQTATGETRIVILSDDNYSRLQRTLLLEFRLND